ncbi:hypothetical protein FA13DRAFT_1157819 [Coprinellus micaceus]|uniref:Uncharacterized protein n=1 Tax=Coprinellus micaceus TaxID=71717 RepID=A0A4Y7SUE5_COPMI|nr:hypothetical protein FA13DRAFT_1157819 [Coprinellus micaceus]
MLASLKTYQLRGTALALLPTPNSNQAENARTERTQGSDLRTPFDLKRTQSDQDNPAARAERSRFWTTSHSHFPHILLHADRGQRYLPAPFHPHQSLHTTPIHRYPIRSRHTNPPCADSARASRKYTYRFGCSVVPPNLLLSGPRVSCSLFWRGPNRRVSSTPFASPYRAAIQVRNAPFELSGRGRNQRCPLFVWRTSFAQSERPFFSRVPSSSSLLSYSSHSHRPRATRERSWWYAIS